MYKIFLCMYPSNTHSQEWEIRRLREASVTSDGMLSCYTPFLLAIVKRRVADAAAAAASAPPLPLPPAAATEDVVLPSAEAVVSGNSSGLSAGGIGSRHHSPRRKISTAVSGVDGRGAAADGREKRPRDGGAVPMSSCPGALCAEALWALSEYAVLSPGLGEAAHTPVI